MNKVINIKKIFTGKFFYVFLFLVFMLIPFILYGNLFLENKVFFAGDGIEFFANKILVRNSILNGELPLWNKYLSGGTPYILDVYQGAFYPISFVLSFLPFKWFVYLFYGIHLTIAGVGMNLYLKELKISRLVSFAVSILYVMSIQFGGWRKEHMVIIQGIVYIPLLLYFLQKYFNTDNKKYLIYLTVIMAVQFLSGYIQTSVYIDIMLFIYYMIIAISQKKKVIDIVKEGALIFFSYIGLILIQLLPAITFVNYYSGGNVSVSYEYFLDYSMHPINLLYFLFPEVLTNLEFNTLYSAEYNVELFFGSIVIFSIFWGARRLIKESLMVKVSTVIIIVSLLFSMCSYIPYLGDFLYKIPVINMFRCPARFLFIGIFFCYVLLGIVLEKLKIKENFNVFKLDIRKYVKYIVLLVVVFCSFGYLYSIKVNNSVNNFESFNTYVHDALFIQSIILIIWVVIVYNIEGIKKFNFYNIFIVLVMISGLVETFPYFKLTASTSIDSIYYNKSLEEIKNKIGNYKLIDLGEINGARKGLATQNRNMFENVATINSYLPINNLKFYKLISGQDGQANFSGIFSGFSKSRHLAYSRNDILSMLGVKYIVDSEDIIDKTGSINQYIGESNIIFEKDQVLINSNKGKLNVLSYNVDIKPYTDYIIKFDFNYKEKPEFFNIDFYGGAEYDKLEQEISFSESTGSNSFKGIINSGDSLKSDKIFIRIMTRSSDEIKLENIKLIELLGEKEVGVYKLTDSTDYKIYENTKVKDILYKPNKIKNIADSEDLYSMYTSDFDEVNYIENTIDKDLTNVNTQINILEFKNNSIKAEVTSDSDSFINFSQCYYPGWKAYVDDNEVNIHEVNLVIFGIEVPKGTHIVEFKFEPDIVYISAFISVCTLIILTIYLINLKRRDRR